MKARAKNTQAEPLLARFECEPRLGWADPWLTALPFLIWAALVLARPMILHPRCGADLKGCAKSDVLLMDQPALGIENGPADAYSFLTQNISGALAISLPPLYQASLFVLNQVTPGVALAAAGVDTVIFLETWGINGAITEGTRLVFQRPRPYVYSNAGVGQDPQNYVSFYSGHTSFSAAALTGLLLILMSRGFPDFGLLALGAVSQCLVIATAVYRILAGRHFVSDVLVGAVMGSAVAVFVALLHRPSFRAAGTGDSGSKSIGRAVKT